MFPCQAGELVKIAWYQGNEYREAEYYRTIAYTFNPKGMEDPKPRSVVQGRPAGDKGIVWRPDSDTKCQYKYSKTCSLLVIAWGLLH
jgi:hypothetical protein